MPGLTKAEQEQLIEDQAAEIERLQTMIAERDAALAQSGEDGYIIETPNKGYSGVTAGVQITRGFGFVPKKREGATNLVLRLKSDYGYTIYEATAEEYNAQLASQPEPEEKGLSMADLIKEGA